MPSLFPQTKNLQVPTVHMHWYTLVCCKPFIYKMPMHRKKVRIHCYLIHVLWCVPLCFKMFNILIGMITPWDPGILLSSFLSNNKEGEDLCPY